MITEKDITEVLKNELEPLPYVYAFWIEGSFAMGYADEYSDIDYWIDVEDDYVKEALEHVEQALERLGELDERDDTGNSHPKLGQIVYHIKGSDPYLVLDFNWQLHSRDRSEYHYIKNDKVEGALVLFDKDNVVRFENIVKLVFCSIDRAQRLIWVELCVLVHMTVKSLKAPKPMRLMVKLI